MRAMETGAMARIEELTRIPADVQDALITILSEKTLPIPELDDEVQARQGFNVIATANDRDRGVNELSSRAAPALQHRRAAAARHARARRWRSSARGSTALGAALELPAELAALAEIRRVVTVFRELRSGVTADGRTKLKSPSATLSTAEAISVMTNGLALAAHFGDGAVRAADVAAGLARRGGEGPGAGPAGVAGVPRDRRARTARLGRPLPRLPGTGLSADR